MCDHAESVRAGEAAFGVKGRAEGGVMEDTCEYLQTHSTAMMEGGHQRPLGEVALL